MKIFKFFTKSFFTVMTCCFVTTAYATDSFIEAHIPVYVEDDARNAVLTWQAFDNTTFQYVLQASSFAPISGWSSLITLSDTTMSVLNPQVSMDKISGNTVVVWSEGNGGLINNLKIAYYSRKDGWSSVYTISTGTETVYYDANAIALHFEGTTVTVSWASFDSISFISYIYVSTGTFGKSTFDTVIVTQDS